MGRKKLNLVMGLASLVWMSSAVYSESSEPGQSRSAPVEAVVEDTWLGWQVLVESAGATLVVTGPSGVAFEEHFTAEEQPVFELGGLNLPDGLYTWELRLEPVRQQGFRGRVSAEDSTDLAEADPGMGGERQFGHFWIRNGLALPDTDESTALPQSMSIPKGPRGPMYAYDVSGDWSVSGALAAGTDTPSSEIDIESSSPSIEWTDTSDGTDGWYMHGWDTSLKVQDKSTANSVMEIEDDAPASTLHLATSGLVGLGTATPAKQLHVLGTSAATVGANNTMARIENASTVTGTRRMLELINNGVPLLVYKNTADGATWSMSPQGTGFSISKGGTGATEMFLAQTGDLKITGDLTANGILYASDRDLKRDVEPLDSEAALQRVAELPVSTWSFKKDEELNRHAGPMAQDFYKAFGFGKDNRHISASDISGVALAAIQGLYQENQALREQLEKLSHRLESLESRIAQGDSSKKDASGIKTISSD